MTQPATPTTATVDTPGPDLSSTSSEGVLLLSGGLDSVALAAIVRPALCLCIDYGQRPARAETAAATAVCEALELPLATLRMDLSALGAGLLSGAAPSPQAPSPEWWPFRNQFLATAAATVAVEAGWHHVYVGTVAGDGDRHADGTLAFYQALDKVLSLQEGNVHVSAPAIGHTTAQLVARSGLSEDILGWSISCHRANTPCGACPGCYKRNNVLQELGLFTTTR